VQGLKDRGIIRWGGTSGHNGRIEDGLGTYLSFLTITRETLCAQGLISVTAWAHFSVQRDRIRVRVFVHSADATFSPIRKMVAPAQLIRKRFDDLGSAKIEPAWDARRQRASG